MRHPGLLAAHDHPAFEDFGPLAWITVVVAGVAVAWVIWKAVRYTLHPGEQEPDHIKWSILEEPDAPPKPLSSGDGGEVSQGAPLPNDDGA